MLGGTSEEEPPFSLLLELNQQGETNLGERPESQRCCNPLIYVNGRFHSEYATRYDFCTSSSRYSRCTTNACMGVWAGVRQEGSTTDGMQYRRNYSFESSTQAQSQVITNHDLAQAYKIRHIMLVKVVGQTCFSCYYILLQRH